MLDEANRANTSFYPIDPRGLAVFDTPIGPNPPPTIEVDQKMLQSRMTSLRTLAEATDGLAIVSTNNIAGGLRRVVDDLTSYYLLGYYATGRLDGRFHSITVRVKRPGVSVRARRGYLAATEVDANAATAATASPSAALSPAAAADARAIGLALSPLEGYARPLPVRLHAAAGWKPGNAAAVWTVGELGPGPEWRGGADVELSLLNPAGATIATAQVRVEPGARAFRALFAPDQPLAPGDYVIRVRVKTIDAADSASDTLRITLRDTPEATGGIFVRHGRSTITRPRHERSSLPADRTAPARGAGAFGRRLHRSSAGSDRKATGRAGCGARQGRRRWVALAGGAVDARAARSGRLRDRDRRAGRGADVVRVSRGPIGRTARVASGFGRRLDRS